MSVYQCIRKEGLSFCRRSDRAEQISRHPGTSENNKSHITSGHFMPSRHAILKNLGWRGALWLTFLFFLFSISHLWRRFASTSIVFFGSAEGVYQDRGGARLDINSYSYIFISTKTHLPSNPCLHHRHEPTEPPTLCPGQWAARCAPRCGVHLPGLRPRGGRQPARRALRR